MAFERFIARRFMPRSNTGGGFSGPLSLVAVASIALGVVVMITAISILRGFQGNITNKVAGFGGHITIQSYQVGNAYQETPIALDSALVRQLGSTPGIRHLQTYATKGGMAKTDSQIYGIILRGFSANYDTTFFASNLVEGRLPNLDTAAPSNQILISSTIASRLQLAVGDKLRCYFWQTDNYRSRAFNIAGIYNTDLTEFDEIYIVGDLRQVQRLNGWADSLIGGYELLVDNLNHTDDIAARIQPAIPYDLTINTLTSQNPALFSWLELLNANITLILTIMCIVSAIAIISALLIMIFEKSATIGVLKTLGATNASIRRIFLIKALRLILEGIAIGDAIALLLCAIQARWAPLRLDPESYSMSHVPVDLNGWVFLAVSLGTAAVCFLALMLPTIYISHINPANTVKVEK